MTDSPKTPDPTATTEKTEEYEISADKLVEKIKELAADAQVTRVRIKEPDGDIAVDIPLVVGAVAGGAVLVAAPILAIVGALVAFFSKVRLEVVREQPKDGAGS